MNTRPKPYFPALDGLRFIGFLLVFLHHTTFYFRGNLGNGPVWSFFNNNGWVGVDIFFVLTGFLITVLFLNERNNRGSFSYGNYLSRRILRILPLYFAAVIVGYFVAPYFFAKVLHTYTFDAVYYRELSRNLPWYLLFMGNWNAAIYGYGYLRAISELWAVSLDLQFYLIWPLILLMAKTVRQGLLFSFFLTVFSILARAYLVHIGVAHPGIYVNTFARLDPFMMGSAIAYLSFYHPSVFKKWKFFSSGAMQIIIGSVMAIFLASVKMHDRLVLRNSIFGYVFIDAVFSYYVFICIATDSIVTRLFRNKLIRYLGRLSYSLYIWHILALELLYNLFGNAKYDSLIPVLGLPMTVIFGVISLYIFEKPFLKIKAAFDR